MTYQEIERYISEIPKFTKKHSLSHTKRFLEILQIPQGKMKILHVAGTNGKALYVRTWMQCCVPRGKGQDCSFPLIW